MLRGRERANLLAACKMHNGRGNNETRKEHDRHANGRKTPLHNGASFARELYNAIADRNQH